MRPLKPQVLGRLLLLLFLILCLTKLNPLPLSEFSSNIGLVTLAEAQDLSFFTQFFSSSSPNTNNNVEKNTSAINTSNQPQWQQQPSANWQQHSTRQRVSWCTTSPIERRKCLDWAKAIEEVNIQFEGRGEPFELNLDCVQGSDRDQCMNLIDDERADMILLDPGEIGVAGRYHSLTPIMVERYAGAGNSLELGHYSVAVVKRRSAATIQSLADLFGKRACFSGVSHMASWTIPLATLIDLPQFEIADCNNLVKSASYFFGNSCAPNALINKFNPTGDNPQKMSLLCDMDEGSRIGAHSEPYRGAYSALKCLAEPSTVSGVSFPLQTNPFDPLESSLMTPIRRSSMMSADVAFLPHNTVFLTEKLSLARELRAEIPARSELELLCPQGGRAPLDKWQSCNFGFVPASAVTVSSRTSPERREAIQRFLRTSVQIFSGSPVTLNSGYTASASQLDLSYNQQRVQSRFPAFSSRQSQQPLSNFDLGYTADSGLRAFDSTQTVATSNPWAGRISTTFRLTGEHSIMNYSSLDVIFSSDMIDLSPLEGVGQTFKGFLNSFPVQPATTNVGQTAKTAQDVYYNYLYGGSRQNDALGSNTIFEVKKQSDYFEKLRRCSVPAAVLCVTSDKEFNKCQAMSKAFHAAGLKPELNCKLAQSTIVCMQLIKNRDADLVVLDAADIYISGLKFGLIPIVSEQIELYESGHHSVAVAKKSDQTIDLFNLKGKLTCQSGYLKGAGWVMPMHFLLSNDRMRTYEPCDSVRSASEHFDKSCAPGILSSVSNLQNSSLWTARNMCELCHGTGRGYCARDASEPFFGDTGAFRCLVEGGGQVAFLKHTAIFENTGGSNRDTWARNLIKSDFELLCRDGTRAPVNGYKSCNLGRVPPSAIVTRGDSPFRLVDAYVNLFMYGQQYYGSKYSEEYTFKMFSSTGGKDLIFQDVTQQLVQVPLVKQTYNSYLGADFIRAMKTVYCS